MAKRKKKRTRKKSNPTRKRTTHRRKRKRSNPSNPRRRRSSHRRRSRSNPHRRRARRAHGRRHMVRAHLSNPKRHHRRRRSHRRNPGGPIVSALIALGLGAATFVATDVVTFYATSDMAKDGQRNRKIVAALGIIGGLFLARKHPVLGVGLAAGAFLAGFGNAIDLAVLQMLPAKSGGQTALAPAPTTKGLGAVAYDNMQALAYEGAPRMLGMGAVAYDNLAGMGAVAYDNLAGWETMGDPVPPPPWESDNPYGN